MYPKSLRKVFTIMKCIPYTNTLFQVFIFCPKIQIVELFWVKTRKNAAVLDFLAVDNCDFTRKIVKKNWVKNS
mgnify:CR=1 FL=1